MRRPVLAALLLAAFSTGVALRCSRRLRPAAAAARARRARRAACSRRGASQRAEQRLRRREDGPDPRPSSTGGCARGRSSTCMRRVTNGGEQGLLSVAFHPRYSRNHLFYVDYTDRGGDTRIVEYRSRGLARKPVGRGRSSSRTIPTRTTTAASSRSGPDGYLYAGMGDGGSGGDPENRAQNLRSPLRQDPALQRQPAASAAGHRRLRRCATPGASRSTGRRATSTSVTSARTPGRSSTTRLGAARGSRTTAGASTRASRATAPTRRRTLRGTSSCPTWCCRTRRTAR